jgi:hypothetical protein
MFQKIERKTDQGHLRKEGGTSNVPPIQDVNWNPHSHNSDFIWKHHRTIQPMREAARFKQTSLEACLPDYGMICHILSRFARSIEITEQGMVTLDVFYFCNVPDDIRMITDNSHASRFANLLERQFSKMADGGFADLTDIGCPTQV